MHKEFLLVPGTLEKRHAGSNPGVSPESFRAVRRTSSPSDWRLSHGAQKFFPCLSPMLFGGTKLCHNRGIPHSFQEAV